MAPNVKSRPQPAVSPEEVDQRAVEIRQTWAKPDLRLKPDPDFALCVAVLDRARVDVLEGQDSLVALRKKRRDAQKAIQRYYEQVLLTRQALKNATVAINWTQHPEHQWMAIDTIARAVDYQPERLAEVIIGGMNNGVAKFIQGEPGSMCPLCRKGV